MSWFSGGKSKYHSDLTANSFRRQNLLEGGQAERVVLRRPDGYANEILVAGIRPGMDLDAAVEHLACHLASANRQPGGDKIGYRSQWFETEGAEPVADLGARGGDLF